jgi:E3 ubiquitin-protein ligase SHPRH
VSSLSLLSLLLFGQVLELTGRYRWWRVIMDEVQLHSDTTDAAYVVPTAGSEELADESSNMVALIPRKNSLAVSGTPAKSDIKDLMGSLRFLRVPVIPHDHRLWHRLQQPSMRLAFEGLFRAISVRTTKKEVTSELHIPRQTRYVVPIDLSEIELHYYNDTLDRQRERLRPRDGVIDKALIRACLLDLRQICTHIQVGQMQERGARAEQRLHLGRELMTMADALEKMRDDHSQDFLIESRLQVSWEWAWTGDVGNEEIVLTVNSCGR